MSDQRVAVGGDQVMTTRAEITPLRQVAGWAAYASGVVVATGLVFLVAMFASFSVGATSLGLAFGRINDVLVMLSYLLALPSAIALRALLRPHNPVLSELAALIGACAIAAIVVLQSLLVVGALTFEQQIGPVSIALLVLAAWFVTTGYLGSSSGALPRGVRMGILAATYVGYPIWAFWMGRHLLRLVGKPVSGPGAGADRHLHSREG